MNIFVTSMDPAESARNLDNKRVVKMIVESAQMLSTSMHVRGLQGPYKPTHTNHPCALAVQHNTRNYNWLLIHFSELCNEYLLRYGKTHKCFQHFMTFYSNPPADNNYKLSLPNCSLFKDEPDLIGAYRKTMIQKWKSDKKFPKWTNRDKPEWFKE